MQNSLLRCKIGPPFSEFTNRAARRRKRNDQADQDQAGVSHNLLQKVKHELVEEERSEKENGKIRPLVHEERNCKQMDEQVWQKISTEILMDQVTRETTLFCSVQLFFPHTPPVWGMARIAPVQTYQRCGIPRL